MFGGAISAAQAVNWYIEKGVPRNKIVTGISLISHGTVVCFTYSDGSVEYRDRFTMAELYTEANMNRINSILEAGFTLRGELSCRYIDYGFGLRVLFC